MQHIYMQSNEHFEVFTTVLAPQGRYRYKAEAEKMAVVRSYRPHWPDELALSPGDVILVVSKHEEGMWFGRLQRQGQWGYFPASCVVELCQTNLPTKGLQRRLSLRVTAANSERSSGHILQALRRGGTRGEGLEGSQVKHDGPFLVRRPQSPPRGSVASQPQLHRSPSLLHRILSKCRKKSECQGAANGAFEGD
ncbi:vexin-like [Anableps anableps]